MKLYNVLCFIYKVNMCYVSGMQYTYNYQSPIMMKYIEELEKKRLKNIEKAYKYFSFFAVYAQMNVVAFGFVEKYALDMEYLLLFPTWFPLDLNYLPYHMGLYTLQFFVIALIVVGMCGLICLLFLVYSHITTEFKIMCYAFENFKEIALERVHRNGRYSSEDVLTREDKYSFRRMLNESYILSSKLCAKHHLDIIE